MAGSFFELENRVGAPIQLGEYRLLPISRALILRLPGMSGGIIWNRPVSVVVQSEGGIEQVLPVRDVTRQVQLALFVGAMFSVLALWSVRRKLDTRRSKQM